MPHTGLSFGMRRAARTCLQFVLMSSLLAAALLAEVRKPIVHVAKDGFPSGHETPEGIASDFARAFINRDQKLFASICIRPHGSGQGGGAYQTFLARMAGTIRDEASKKEPSGDLPRRIRKVFAARRLTRNGPASYGYAAFDFQDVMFVDVSVDLRNGQRILKRTLVIRDSDGRWYIHPAPNLDPLLSDGLNQETTSSLDFSDVYDVQK